MDDFHAKMAEASVAALWEQHPRHNYPPEAAAVWHWKTMAPLITEAVNQTDMQNAERRVIVLQNPALAKDGRAGAAINLSVNLQVLMPGEKARPHRHTMHALRFALEGDGADTIVEGKVCPMLPGDMILTPGWTWHEHRHLGKERAVWVDALDVPMHAYLENGGVPAGPGAQLTRRCRPIAASRWASPPTRRPRRSAIRRCSAMPGTRR